MKEFNITTLVKECSYDELSAGDRKLVDKAKEMTRTSLAEYSGFHVGAAILLANGEIIGGSNQENAAFPSSLCAERTAAYYASANYPGMAMKKLAVAAWTRKNAPEGLPVESYFQAMPISPCGACRQALLEYEHLYGPIEVILYGREKCFIFNSISSLLPFCFTEF